MPLNNYSIDGKTANFSDAKTLLQAFTELFTCEIHPKGQQNFLIIASCLDSKLSIHSSDRHSKTLQTQMKESIIQIINNYSQLFTPSPLKMNLNQSHMEDL